MKSGVTGHEFSTSHGGRSRAGTWKSISSIHDDEPLSCRGFLITFISRMFKISQTVISVWSMFFSRHPQVLLSMQYVILGVALHEVLIAITLGHDEANVKSFEKE